MFTWWLEIKYLKWKESEAPEKRREIGPPQAADSVWGQVPSTVVSYAELWVIHDGPPDLECFLQFLWSPDFIDFLVARWIHN